MAPATPTGYHGQISASDLRAAFREQVAALAEAGVDLLMFETFSTLSEMVEALGVAREVTDLPIVAQMTFVEDGRTLAGDTPAEVATTLESLDVAAIGANCALGPQGLLEILRELARHTDLPLAAQPNAGPPTLLDGRFRYTADPAYFARYAHSFVQAGAALVGGCCGTTPDHIEAVAAAIGSLPVAERPRTARRAPRADGPPAPPTPASSSSPLADKLAAQELRGGRRAAAAGQRGRRGCPPGCGPAPGGGLRRRGRGAGPEHPRPGQLRQPGALDPGARPGPGGDPDRHHLGPERDRAPGGSAWAPTPSGCAT